MGKKIEFDKNKLWKEGCQVPDRLLTINKTDAYKLLEALNIDWHNIDIPWASRISKWNAAGVSPFSNDVTAAINAAAAQSRTENNTVDWYDSKYDYLKDNGYFDEDHQEYNLPDWSVNGQINNSEDIIDIINYILWRIVVLDFYTNNWDSRDSAITEVQFVIGKWSNSSILQLPDSTPNYPDNWNPQYFYSWANANTTVGHITLKPTQDRSPQKIFIDDSTIDMKSLYDKYNALNSNDKSDVYLLLCSTSWGNIMIQNSHPFMIPIANIGGDGSEDNFVTLNDQADPTKRPQYIFKVNIQVKGTADEFYTGEAMINQYKLNSYTYFDPANANVTLSARQMASTVMEKTMSELSFSMNIKIDKTYNTLNSLSFGGVSISFTGTNGISTITDGIRTIGTRYTGKATNGADVEIPYFVELDGYNNKYEINFNLTYGNDHGIYPFFLIKEEGNIATGFIADYVNEIYTCDYGRIEYDSTDNKYYFTPCTNINDTIKILTIECIFYYKDNEYCRPLTPIFAQFKVKLNAKIKNLVQFSSVGETHTRLNRSSGVWERRSDINGSKIIPEADNTELRGETDNGVAWCISTITYDDEDILDSFGNLNTFCFGDFIHTLCDNTTDLNIELIGRVNSSVNDIILDETTNENVPVRQITVASEETNGNWGSVTNAVNTYNIYKEKNIKVGSANDKSFYYSDDTVENYTLSKTVKDALNLLDPADSSNVHIIETIDANFNPNEYYNNASATNNQYQQKTFAWTLLKSTAKYPDENGIINIGSNENPTWVDADNDYDFLVIKVSAPEGISGSVAYTATEGYLFLRILRKYESLSLSFKDYYDGKEIIYQNGQKTNDILNNYSMRVITRSPIYLNRLFNNESQNAIAKHTGKQYWEFYNADGSILTSNKWNNLQVAIRNIREGENEEYMKIWNIGDTYPVSQYVQSHNVYTEIVPEGNGYVPDFSSTTNRTVGKINDNPSLLQGNAETTLGSISGAILYVNKLMRAVSAVYDGDHPDSYEAVTENHMELTLGLSIGNDNKYKRLPQSLPFLLNVYKQKYDFELLVIPMNAATNTYNTTERIISTYNKTSNSLMLAKHEWANVPAGQPNGNTNIQLIPLNINSQNNPYQLQTVTRIFIGSNSFGLTDDATTIGDQIKIVLNNDVPQISLVNGNYKPLGNDAVAVISLESNLNNENWIDPFNNVIDLTPYKNAGKNIAVFYSTALNDYGSLTDVTSDDELSRYGIFLFALNSTGVSAQQLRFKISGDNFGIFDDKYLTLFYKVNFN